MTTILEAIYENGKLVLSQPLPLPENAHVRVTIETQDASISDIDRTAWLKLSEQALLQTWNNTADDVFDELLKK